MAHNPKQFTRFSIEFRISKTASKKLRVMNKVRQYFIPKLRLQPYKVCDLAWNRYLGRLSDVPLETVRAKKLQFYSLDEILLNLNNNIY